MTPKNDLPLIMNIIGSSDFCRRYTSLINLKNNQIKISSGIYADAWNLAVSTHPNIILVEIGPHYSERTHEQTKKFITRAKEQFGNQVYIIVALLSCEKLFFGGDLLFANEANLEPAKTVDTFIVRPPASLPAIPGLTEQLNQTIDLISSEYTRRAQGQVALPTLSSQGWVQSLADPQSRELWMKWLPRYATYTNESPIIIGPTGTGKTNLAYALHLLSNRPGQFVSITPRDFSSSELVQAELFGAVPGAYTGSVERWGLVKQAEKGTLFIDELQSVDKELQGRLITFIENKVYRRVGSPESIAADVRFVFASNRTLDDMMESDVLRHDFAYRLERVQLELLPLCARRLDITAALAHALAKIPRQRPQVSKIYGVSADAYQLLFGQRWPGNLRQLENIVAQLREVTDMAKANIINHVAVGKVFKSKLSGASRGGPEIITDAAAYVARNAISQNWGSLTSSVEQFTMAVRNAALESTGGDTEAAAELIQDQKSILNLIIEGQALKKI